MCSLGYHTCPECGEEMPCYQPDYDCVALNSFEVTCEKCEYWMEELHKETERKAEWDRQQRERWEAEYGYEK